MRRLTYVFVASGFIGLFWAVLSAIRWMIFFPDISNAIFGFSIGIGLSIISAGFGYIYEKLYELKQKQRNMDERWDSFVQGKKSEEELNLWKNKK